MGGLVVVGRSSVQPLTPQVTRRGHPHSLTHRLDPSAVRNDLVREVVGRRAVNHEQLEQHRLRGLRT